MYVLAYMHGTCLYIWTHLPSSLSNYTMFLINVLFTYWISLFVLLHFFNLLNV